MVVLERGAEHVILPVAGDSLGVVDTLAGADYLAIERIEVYACEFFGTKASHILLELDIFVGAHGLDALHLRCHCECAFVHYFRIALRAFFGLYEDYTVGATRTVDGYR